jgi:hypothetical protein
MRAIVVVRSLTGLLWLIQLVVGVLFWTGHALGLMQFHMVLGVVFVLSLWTLTFLCARAGASRGRVAATAVWGAVVVLFGMTQIQILPGSYHWIIRTLHLLVGVAAMAFAGRLTMSVLPRAGGHRPPQAGFVPHPGRG